MQEEFQDQIMNVEVCEECRKNSKTRLGIWKHTKRAERISRQDFKFGSMQRVQEEFQDKALNIEACEECRKNFKTRL